LRRNSQGGLFCFYICWVYFQNAFPTPLKGSNPLGWDKLCQLIWNLFVPLNAEFYTRCWPNQSSLVLCWLPAKVECDVSSMLVWAFLPFSWSFR
jgi:hypothetical protein